MFIILVVLIVTRVAAEVTERIGQPALAGELLAGVALGAFFPVLGVWLAPMGPAGVDADAGPLSCGGLIAEDVFRSFADLGVFFLMLLAGMEVQPNELRRASGRGMLIGTSGLLVPFMLGCLLAIWILPATDNRLALIVFMGTALSITAVPIAAKVLLDLGMLHSAAGKAILSAALFDDVLSLIILAALTALIETGSVPGAAAWLELSGKILTFLAIVLVTGYGVMPRIIHWLDEMLAPEIEFSTLLIVALAFAVLAEALGLHFILGAFAGGMFFANARTNEAAFADVHRKITGSTYGLLAPLFFASIGMQANFTALAHTPILVLMLILVAVAGKLIGCGLPAYWSGMSSRDSLAVGVGMTGRGAVELIIANIALGAGLFDNAGGSPIVGNLFSAIVIMTILTTWAMPIALKAILVERRPT